MLESTLSEEKSKRVTKLSTSLLRSKDLLPRPDLEEREFSREIRFLGTKEKKSSGQSMKRLLPLSLKKEELICRKLKLIRKLLPQHLPLLMMFPQPSHPRKRNPLLARLHLFLLLTRLDLNKDNTNNDLVVKGDP